MPRLSFKGGCIMSDTALPVLGFVGTGTINSALVKGF